MVDMDDVHGLQEFFCLAGIAHGEIKARVCQRQTRAADDVWFVILVIEIAKGEDEHFMTSLFEILLIDLDVVGDAADIRFITVNHHSNSHNDMLRHARTNVKWEIRHGRITAP